MPVLYRFGGFVIRMYANDHNPPHVHIESADFRALVAIGRIEILQGAIPAKHRDEALRWIEENQAMLLRRWEDLQ